jgi:hypothetical protein
MHTKFRLENLGAEGSIKLEWNLVWEGVVWLRLGTSDGLL